MIPEERMLCRRMVLMPKCCAAKMMVLDQMILSGMAVYVFQVHIKVPVYLQCGVWRVSYTIFFPCGSWFEPAFTSNIHPDGHIKIRIAVGPPVGNKFIFELVFKNRNQDLPE